MPSPPFEPTRKLAMGKLATRMIAMGMGAGSPPVAPRPMPAVEVEP